MGRIASGNDGIFLFFEGGRERGKRSRQAFPISVSARFSYSPSALGVHCFLGCLLLFVYDGNVRPAQTGCARTGGHLILEKPAASVSGIPCFLAVVCCCNGYRLFNDGYANMKGV